MQVGDPTMSRLLALMASYGDSKQVGIFQNAMVKVANDPAAPQPVWGAWALQFSHNLATNGSYEPFDSILQHTIMADAYNAAKAADFFAVIMKGNFGEGVLATKPKWQYNSWNDPTKKQLTFDSLNGLGEFDKYFNGVACTGLVTQGAAGTPLILNIDALLITYKS